MLPRMGSTNTVAHCRSVLGQRVHVIGNTGAGKSTLAAYLAACIGGSVVELDALNWLPNWVGLNEHNPDMLDARVREATAGHAWVVAGSYSATSQRVFWSRLQTVVWLDLPLRVLVVRVVNRSYSRFRNRELLWGTNYENFWHHLKVWSPDSLVHWAVTQHRRKRKWMLEQQLDPRWGHIRFIRLRSTSEVEDLRRSLQLPKKHDSTST